MFNKICRNMDIRKIKASKIKPFTALYVRNETDEKTYFKIAFKIVGLLYKDRLFACNNLKFKHIYNYLNITQKVAANSLLYTFGLTFFELLRLVRSFEMLALLHRTESLELNREDLTSFCNIDYTKANRIIKSSLGKNFNSIKESAQSPNFADGLNSVSKDLIKYRSEQKERSYAFIDRLDKLE